MTRALIVAAPRSGAGKTTLTLGLLRALRRAGHPVRAAKSGPDYIDPAFHHAATGAASFNLDAWAMPPAQLAHLAANPARPNDLLVIEAAMGLFDGADATGPGGGDGSAASLARTLAAPVLLVLDVSGQSRSAAAVAHGFATLDPHVTVAGIVLNRVASPRHAAQARSAIEAAGLPVLGALPRRPDLQLPERHLGLVQAAELPDLDAKIDALADFVADHVDLDAIAALATPLSTPEHPHTPPPPPAQHIAIASDAAFAFAYPHLLAAWHDAGATLHPFSPLADQPPDPDADLVWLPGGYPELHAPRLAAAHSFLAGLRAARTAIHGECGGHMVLGEAITDAEGRRHPMAGLLHHETSFAARRLTLGYRTARLATSCVLGPAGRNLAGHEFHYATTLATDRPADPPFAHLHDGAGATLGPTGGTATSPAGARVTGSFFHLVATP